MSKMIHDEPIVVAEIGCNHLGDMDTARRMIDTIAEYCRAPVAKFQKRTPRELLSPEQYNAPHPNPRHSYGDTYGAHREYLEFSADDHRTLKEYCEARGVVYSSSVWDLTSAREISALAPQMIKIPSALNTHADLIRFLSDEYGGSIHVSTGMSTRDEVDELVALLEKRGRAEDAVLYACTSGYPVPFSDVKLLEIEDLRDRYGSVVGAVGFSGHHLGIAIDIAAYALGATWIERHFTLDRTWKGTDHAASLEPDGLRKLVRDLNATHAAMGHKGDGLVQIEEEQRRKLKWVQ